MNQTVSVIIPTHNRCKTLQSLLNLLGRQSYPLHLLEVVVVADGCRDATIEMLRHYQAPFKLRYLEQGGQGPAVARNAGAAAATGHILLFLDDDIEPSGQLLAAHAQAHATPNRVVVGYLPFSMPKKSGFYHQQLRLWWEEKFQQMRTPGYRYSYEDLLSGNFSLPASLFKQVNGFDLSLRCREDYELGMRLIASNATFLFSKEAWGYHRDEVTDFARSLWRKRQEGSADTQFGRLHPALVPMLRLASLRNSPVRFKFFLTRFAFSSPAMADRGANLLYKAAILLERLHLRVIWKILSEGLHEYWYFRGVSSELPTGRELDAYFGLPTTQGAASEEIEIDLLDGLEAAEQQVDQLRPASARLVYGSQPIGNIPYRAGAERLRGSHLRLLLATTLAWPLTQALAIAGVVASSNNADQLRHSSSLHSQ